VIHRYLRKRRRQRHPRLPTKIESRCYFALANKPCHILLDCKRLSLRVYGICVSDCRGLIPRLENTR
jgi:hypothetical protein